MLWILLLSKIKSMGFFSNLKQAYNVSKELAPSVFKGIKQGLVVGRQLIDIAKDTARELKDIPRLGNLLDKFVHSSGFTKTEDALQKGQAIGNGIDFVVNGGKPLPDKNAKQLFPPKVKPKKQNQAQQDQQAMEIANNMMHR